MISTVAIRAILGIKEDVDLDVKEMIKKVSVSFLPHIKNPSEQVLRYSNDLKNALSNLGVRIVPYGEIWEIVPLKKRLSRFFKYIINNCIWLSNKIFVQSSDSFYIPIWTIVKLCSKRRIRSGISLVCTGTQDEKMLAMQHIRNFKTNSIITIIDLPDHVIFSDDFSVHFNTSMEMFAYHMTNVIIGVGSSRWILYNFNASHPSFVYPDKQIELNISKSLIPKIAAPISPNKLEEFVILPDRFDPRSGLIGKAIADMYDGSVLFEGTGLFPNGKNIDDLPFRNNFHRLIGKLHLDNRNGMSFGFLAYQLPSHFGTVETLSSFRTKFPDSFINNDIYAIESNNREIYILCVIDDIKLVLKVPEVWVVTIRSGAKKTAFDVDRDPLLIGLRNGIMFMQYPKDLIFDQTIKPSFDTKVILSNAVSNSIIASLLNHLKINNDFVRRFSESGLSISHWHGYFNKNVLSNDFTIYGENNPHVSCSSPQAAIYAMRGKLERLFASILESNRYIGDVHVEPHHGVNVTYPSTVELAEYILRNPGITALGNKYL